MTLLAADSLDTFEATDPLRMPDTLDALAHKVAEMLARQCAANVCGVPPGGEQRGFAWHRAVYVGTAQAYRHLNASDLPKFKATLMDIWYLGLALWLESEPADKPASALPRRIAMNMRSALRKHKPSPVAREDVINAKRLVLLDKLVAAAGSGQFCLDSFVGLMVHCDLSFEDLHAGVVQDAQVTEAAETA